MAQIATFGTMAAKAALKDVGRVLDIPLDRVNVMTKLVPARLGITLEEAMQRHAADYALRRVTTDTDVANACLFLASDVSRQITGVDLPVDGGWAAL